jgi:hypothetical protein
VLALALALVELRRAGGQPGRASPIVPAPEPLGD